MLLNAAPIRILGLRLSTIPSTQARNLSRLRFRGRLPKSSNPSHETPKPNRKWTRRAAVVGFLSAGSIITLNTYDPARHATLAVDRISRCVWAVGLSAWDYKRTLTKDYGNDDAMLQAYSDCHYRSAKRLLHALQHNGGIFIKLGQHMSSVQMLPYEWTSTMRPLQDQCIPTSYEALDAMVLHDTGKSIDELFVEFDPNPIGVASLAQVHIGRDRETGRKVAVKLQHPHLEEFAEIDMATATWCLAWVKQLFPEFEFTWLGEEMRQNLPLELDFQHEAENAARATADFSKHRYTTLYIPKVYHSTKRVMTMEFIEGARVDDLEYLQHLFHADPHPGNLLIRPAPSGSRSPYNFEICLLDHGLYFDIDDELRVNYAHLWLSLIAPPSAKTQADRRKYAQLVGKIDPEMYPVFESAITGRANLKALEDQPDTTSLGFKRSGSLLESLPQSEEEIEAIRRAVLQKEGLIEMVFELLRRMPRRVLMILKLNDLTRNLDTALKTTHTQARIFTIVARYCSLAVWIDQRKEFFSELRRSGPSLSAFRNFVSSWVSFHVYYDGLRLLEMGMDISAHIRMTSAWLRGLWANGLVGAERAAAGLDD
ncbi:hypothetical protein FRC04_009728 [Tulasnella sp. 424]|nr:hypothetical protein FRC04_009728 [Tulasnella sp. 424]KAG8973163.1 hypothetical protein FRC05_009023 [Tulasnella sp. 425]